MAVNRAQPVLPNRAAEGQSDRKAFPKDRLFWLLIAAGILVFAAATFFRLGASFERDYDEGVYWQSLRAMAKSLPLYGQIFYSQPPAFLLALFPVYMVFGQTIFAARLGVVFVSVLGLVGALLAGKALRGKWGMVAVFLFMATNPFFVSATRTLQADAPVAAMMLLTVGLAYTWWSRPTGAAGYLFASLTGVTLALSIMLKLFGLAAAIPVLLLAIAHLLRGQRLPEGTRFSYSAPLLVGFAAFLLVGLLMVLPFRSVLPQLWDQVIAFHLAAKALVHNPLAANAVMLVKFLLRTPLVLLAGLGMLISLLRRDWLVLPLIAWFLALIALLVQQAPLFPHHVVTLIPALAVLAVRTVDPLDAGTSVRSGNLPGMKIVIIVSLVLVAGLSAYKLVLNDRQHDRLSASDTQMLRDLDSAVDPGELVISDEQFLTALADRSPPAALVDSSGVHIQSGYLTTGELLSAAADPKVRAVLLYSGRLVQLPGLKEGLSGAFHPLHEYGPGRELWVKK